jgi:hypothetical protein
MFGRFNGRFKDDLLVALALAASGGLVGAALVVANGLKAASIVAGMHLNHNETLVAGNEWAD